MLQQINLYSLLPRKAKPWLTKKNMLILCVIFLGLFFCGFINALWKKHQLKLEYAHEYVLLMNAQHQFNKLIAYYPSIDVKNLKNVGANLRTQLINEEKIINLLAQSSKFSAYLEGLAQSTISNVWLTDILFSANEPKIVLKGNAMQPQEAQVFLDELLRQPIFLHLPFKISDLRLTSLDQKNIIHFNITTGIPMQL